MKSDYSIENLIRECRENKHVIEAYLKGISMEGYNDGLTEEGTKIMGYGIAVFLLILLCAISIWIWAIVVLVKFWKVLPDWARIIGVLALLPMIPGGPIITLIVVYASKNSSGENQRNNLADSANRFRFY